MATATAAVATAAGTAFASLTTTFTPPAACATQFMMLQNDAFRIWMNPLSPANGITATSCYASQWLQSSSSAAFSPLVCPSGYQTQSTFTSPAGYMACCPGGFDGIALVSNAPSDRPASGATCYSNIFSSAILVTTYNASTMSTSSIYTATDSSAQAYAYAYDGFNADAVANPASSPSASGSTTSSSASSTSTASQDDSDSSIGGGAIAGIVIGVIFGIAFLVLLSAFLLRRRRKKQQGAAQDAIHEVHGESASQDPYSDNVGGAGDVKDKKSRRVSELSAARRTSELAASSPAPMWELQGTEVREQEEQREKERRERGNAVSPLTRRATEGEGEQ